MTMPDDQATARENAFGHLALACKFAAASREVATWHPTLARELADESRDLLALVEENVSSGEPAEPDVIVFDEFDEADGSGPSFRRFREKQKRLIPPPPEEAPCRAT